MGAWFSSYWGYADDDEIDPVSKLTGKEKRLVTETWGIAKKDPMKLGIAIMINLLTEHPDYQSQFRAFKDVPLKDLPTHKRFQVHCSAIVGGIGAAVDSLKDSDLLEATLLTLGEKHYKRGQTKDQFNGLKLILLDTFKEFLGSRWNPELNTAWNNTLDNMYRIIFKAYAQ